jgi:predicted SAM-dependent methyltransferase
MQKLHVGCGRNYKKGWINMDVSSLCGADVIGSIHDTHYFNNTFDEVLAENVLCQIQDTNKFIKTMNELHRITKPTGTITIRVPNAKDICAWQDPVDTRRFTDQSFTYMEHGHRRYEQYGKHYGFPPFTVELLEDNGRQMTFKLCPVK